MSKLLKLKEWLTLQEAARHLSIMFGEQVTEADVLRLGLDGHLRLSVNFVNRATARRGRVSRYTDEALRAAIASGNLPADLQWVVWPPDLVASFNILPESAQGKSVTSLVSLKLDDERYLTLGDQVKELEGIWDLPMLGGERLDVEHWFQRLTDGPAVTLETFDGAFVQREDGEIWQLQESFDSNPFKRGSRAALERLQTHIAENNIAPGEAAGLLATYQEDRKKYLADRKLHPNNDYYPAGSLPRDAVVVVRTGALLDLQQQSEDRRDEKPLAERERNTLYRIIGVLSKEAGLDLTKPSKAGLTMESWAASMGVDLAKRTAEEHLKRVAASMEGSKS
ncbi:hypothetical protein ACCC97_19080 [Variovorax sp. Varisp85]|uniref:hypothetical protein n=1 Tax=Variovorax sp. Varisp85 TaxID=3243059 RepID=UPI0039A7639A